MGEVEVTTVKPKISKDAVLRKLDVKDKKNSSNSPDGKKESVFEMMFKT